MWLIYTMEYYLAMRKIEILPFAARWMELEDIMLSEVSQSERQISCFHSYVYLRNLTEDQRGRKGEKVVSNREGGKP